MNSINIEDKKATFRLALFLGELMLRNGAETYRIEDSIVRVCKSRGYTYTSAFVTQNVIIISDERFDGISFMKRVETRSVNLAKIDSLNSFSREFVSNPEMSLSEGRRRLKEIETMSEYKLSTTYIGMALGSATFSLLLGSNLNDFIFTFLVATLTSKIYDYLIQLNCIHVFTTLVTAFSIALAGSVLKITGLVNDQTMLIIGSIIPLFPGVDLVKGVRDLISGHVLSGLSRAFEACITAVSIAAGVGIVLNLLTVSGGVL